MKRLFGVLGLSALLSIHAMAAVPAELIAPTDGATLGCSSNPVWRYDDYWGCFISVGSEPATPDPRMANENECRAFCRNLANDPRAFTQKHFGPDAERWLSAYKFGRMGVETSGLGLQEIPIGELPQSDFPGYYLRFGTQMVEFAGHPYRNSALPSDNNHVSISFYKEYGTWRVVRWLQYKNGSGASKTLDPVAGEMTLLDFENQPFATVKVNGERFEIRPRKGETAIGVSASRAGKTELTRVTYRGQTFEYSAPANAWSPSSLTPIFASSPKSQARYRDLVLAGKKFFKSNHTGDGVVVGDSADIAFPSPKHDVLTDASVFPAAASFDEPQRKLLARVYKDPKGAHFYTEGEDFHFSVTVAHGGDEEQFFDNGSKRTLMAILESLDVKRIQK
jgi:hypothetical protein